MSSPDVALDRLEHQLKWYDKESARSKRIHPGLKKHQAHLKKPDVDAWRGISEVPPH